MSQRRESERLLRGDTQSCPLAYTHPHIDAYRCTQTCQETSPQAKPSLNLSVSLEALLSFYSISKRFVVFVLKRQLPIQLPNNPSNKMTGSASHFCHCPFVDQPLPGVTNIFFKAQVALRDSPTGNRVMSKVLFDLGPPNSSR